jgi:cell division protein FtsW (lipid II flippase)
MHSPSNKIEIIPPDKEISSIVSLLHKPISENEILQRRLLVLSAAFLFTYNLALTFSNFARYHSWTIQLHWLNWIGFTVWVFSMVFLEKESNRLISQHNPYVLPVIGLLIGWGLVTVWRLDVILGFRQSLWLIIGTLAMWVCFRYQRTLEILREYKYLWLISSILLTTLTFFFGTYPAGEGPRLWLGFSGVYFQPSELLKLLLIVFLAAYLAERIPVSFNFLQLILPTVVLFLIALFILVAQRDLGTASLFIIFYVIMIYLAIGKKRLLVLAGAFLIAVGILGYQLFSIVQIRVSSWINPWLDPSGSSYQIIQSLIGIAAGGIFGRGPGLGSPGIIPVAYSDFIFSAIAEETGMLGTFALFCLLAILVVNGLRIALNANNQFQRFLAAGITVYTVLQSILIIGGNLRLFPLTGVTLPFISYGGSSLVTSFISAGLLLIIGKESENDRPLLVQKTPYQIVGSLLLVGITALSLTNGWWAFLRSSDLQTRIDNPRHSIGERYVPRGTILDREGNPIVTTVGTPGDYSRAYLYPSMSAVTGYDNALYGQAGIESLMNGYLEGISGNSSSSVWFAHFLYGQTPPGSDIRLSIDLSTQRLADKLLMGRTGSIVVMNLDTGEILSMSSQPSYDPNQLTLKGSEWLSNPKSLFFNRATQAQYPIGLAIGPFLLSSFLQGGFFLPELPENLNAFVDGNFFTCAISSPDTDSWGESISTGCPGAILALGNVMGKSRVMDMMNKFQFNSIPSFILPVSPSKQIDSSKSLESILLGNAQAFCSPLQMAIAGAMISNNGYNPTPRLVTAFRSSQYGWVSFSLPDKVHITGVESDKTTKELASTFISGWETISVVDSTLGEITWYLAGTTPEREGNPVVVVIALEENNPLLALQMGRSIFNQASLP